MDFASARKRMVERQLRLRGVTNDAVLSAMGSVERHLFVPDSMRSAAYEDHPLPIGHGQTISQPYMVAYMTQCLQLEGGEKILEIGAGSGYQAAVLAAVGCEVVTVERVDALVEGARKNLEAAGYSSCVRVEAGDGTLGYPDEAPFGRIIVTAAGPEIPRSLLEQLAVGGVLVMPVGSRWLQDLVRVRRAHDGDRRENMLGCVFVPLIGAEGWKESR